MCCLKVDEVVNAILEGNLAPHLNDLDQALQELNINKVREFRDLY